MAQGRDSSKTNKGSQSPRKKLRLVKVTIQPTFVIDDGETLTEVSGQPILVSASEWPDYPNELRKLMAEREDELNP